MTGSKRNTFLLVGSTVTFTQCTLGLPKVSTRVKFFNKLAWLNSGLSILKKCVPSLTLIHSSDRGMTWIPYQGVCAVRAMIAQNFKGWGNLGKSGVVIHTPG